MKATTLADKPPAVGLTIPRDIRKVLETLDRLASEASTTLVNLNKPITYERTPVYMCCDCDLSFRHREIFEEHRENSHRRTRA